MHQKVAYRMGLEEAEERARERIEALEAALRPFATAHRLFRTAGCGAKLPADVAGAVCMQDFARAAELVPPSKE
jgi:hypothetical protein